MVTTSSDTTTSRKTKGLSTKPLTSLGVRELVFGEHTMKVDYKEPTEIPFNPEARQAMKDVEMTNARAWTASVNFKEASDEYAAAKRRFRLALAYAEKIGISKEQIYDILSGRERFS